ncbi:MAG: hypothetical protein KDA20_03500 [Phycisphaerales bacterium]|nr:hypothetical protein [Phycisphaerales bacterium]
MTIPAIYGRVPSLLASQLSLRALNHTNLDLLRTSEQLATGLRVGKGSDDPVAASLIGSLDSELELSEQRDRNLSHGDAVLSSVDASLGELSDMVLEARSVASSQVGIGSDAGTRASQAEVIGQSLTQLFATINRSYAGIHYFAGGQTGANAMETYYGGYRYLGDRDGLRTDLGPDLEFPITVAADLAVGALSARVAGDVDLDPVLTSDTLVRDLRGPTEGKILGILEITVNGATTLKVDLAHAETVGDIADLVESTIRDQAPGVLAGAYPGGVAIAGDRLQILVAGANTVEFADGPTGETASALGLSGTVFNLATSTTLGVAGDLNPRVTERTLFSSMAPGAAAVGDVTFSNGNRQGTVTTDPTMTVGEFAEAVRRLDLGIRVEVAEGGDSINIVNETAGLRMSVTDRAGSSVASALGVRTFMSTTPVTALNDGRGVEIADGELDENGLPDASRNVDFEVTLSDGSTFTVDLVPADLASVQAVVDKINAEWVASGVGGGFVASINPDTNGILFEDAAGGTSMSVRSLNAYAAEDLGLLDGATSAIAGGAQLAGSDRSTVRVESLFSSLSELQVALETNDERGITFAGERLEADVERIAEARALVGTRVRRVEQAREQLGASQVLDRKIKSELQDLDFVEASSRFSLLQTQLQAALQVTAQLRSLSLLNFLS